jgi:transcriptional regulator with XRE-family HTH domain
VATQEQPGAERLDGIGARLREEREQRRISQRELARRIGLSASLISQIETGQSKPSVGTLYAIVTELGMSLDRLFRPPDDESVPPGDEASGRGGGAGHAGPAVHPQERRRIDLESGVRWERLTREDAAGVDFLFVVYDVGGASTAEDSLMRHPGREYGYVLTGRLGVQLGFETHVLDPGDSIAFDSTQPHRLWNTGDEPVQGIWFVVGRDA